MSFKKMLLYFENRSKEIRLKKSLQSLIDSINSNAFFQI